MADFNLSISGIDDDDLLQDDTRRLIQDLGHEFDARPATTDAIPGERAGEAVAIGEIVLALISSGAAVAILEVFKGYFARRRSAEVTVSRPDGASLSIRADQLSDSEYQETLARAEAFLEDGK